MSNYDYTYEKISKFWEKKKVNLFNYSNILIPINLNNLHWALVSVNIHERKMDYFDSLRNETDGLRVMNELALVFSEFLKRNKHKEEEALFFNDDNIAKLPTTSILSQEEPNKFLTTSFLSNISNISNIECLQNNQISGVGKFSNFNFSSDNSDSDSENDITMISSFWNFRFPKVCYQNNGSDCGVFMIKFMECISSNEKITFTQEEIQYYRHQIAMDLIEKSEFFSNTNRS